MARLILVFLTVALSAGPAVAQSLAQVARKEKERRSEVRSASRVITNKDLKPGRSGAVPVPPAPPPAENAGPEGGAPGAAGTPAPADEDTAAEEEQQEEQAWRQKMADARLRLERNEMYLDALQSKINALWAEFTARDDPAQRAQIELERQRALAESERVQAEIGEQRQAIVDLEEEGRRAGVPPGWLR